MILWVIFFSLGKGQTGEGQKIRHAGELFQRKGQGSGDGAAEANRRADRESPPAGEEDPDSWD